MPEAPEGWYPDPAAPGEECYWLGDRWTNARRAVQAPPAPTPPPPPAGTVQPLATRAEPGALLTAPAPAPAAAPDIAVTDYGKRAMVVGIIALFAAVIPGISFIAFIPAILAIGLGIAGLRGKSAGRALAGIIEGGVALIVAIVVSSTIIGGTFDSDRSSSMEPSAAVPKETVEPSPEPAAEPTPVPEPAVVEPAPAPEPAAGAGYGTYPDAQAQFVSIVEDSAAAISSAETDLQRSQLLITRDQALCTVPGVAAVVENWVGEVIEIGANGDGLAYVTIEISPTVVVKTWNNAFSDIGDDTLIGPDAPFFQTLVPMTTGTKVLFSGDFLDDDGVCVSGANLTEVFYGSDPDFLVRFSNVVAQ